MREGYNRKLLVVHSQDPLFECGDTHVYRIRFESEINLCYTRSLVVLILL